MTVRRLFKSRLKSLVGAIKKEKTWALNEELALAHDRALFPVPTHNYRGEPRWDGSEVQRLLKQDVAAGVHNEKTPTEFYTSRPEYQVYPLQTFREHIYQEIHFSKFCTWRNEDVKVKKSTDWML
jgi:hypothetical protein